MKHRASVGGRVFDVFNMIFMVLIGLICIYPFYYTIIGSFSSAKEMTLVVLWPRGLTVATYKQIFALPGLFQSVLISVSRTVLGTALTVYFSGMLGYLMTKPMRFRKFVYRFCVVTMYFSAGLVPWYLVMRMYGLHNSYLLYILPSAIGMFYVILIKTYVESLPASLEESAAIDGAGFFTVFNRIVFPLCKPILATVAVYSAVGQWNSWQDNYFLVDSKGLMTLSLQLYNVLHRAQALATQMMISTGTASTPTASPISPVTVQMAMVVISIVPIMLVYPFLQRFFTKGIMIGAVKG